MGQEIRFQQLIYHTAIKFPTANYTVEIDFRKWLTYLTAVGNTTDGINNTNDFFVFNIEFM